MNDFKIENTIAKIKEIGYDLSNILCNLEDLNAFYKTLNIEDYHGSSLEYANTIQFFEIFLEKAPNNKNSGIILKNLIDTSFPLELLQYMIATLDKDIPFDLVKNNWDISKVTLLEEFYKNGYDLSFFKENYSLSQLFTIETFYKQGFDPKTIVNTSMSTDKMNIILDCLESGLDIMPYKDNFTFEQLRGIKKILLKEKDGFFVDKTMIDPKFSPLQIKAFHLLDINLLNWKDFITCKNSTLNDIIKISKLDFAPLYFSFIKDKDLETICALNYGIQNLKSGKTKEYYEDIFKKFVFLTSEKSKKEAAFILDKYLKYPRPFADLLKYKMTDLIFEQDMQDIAGISCLDIKAPFENKFYFCLSTLYNNISTKKEIKSDTFLYLSSTSCKKTFEDMIKENITLKENSSGKIDTEKFLKDNFNELKYLLISNIKPEIGYEYTYEINGTKHALKESGFDILYTLVTESEEFLKDIFYERKEPKSKLTGINKKQFLKLANINFKQKETKDLGDKDLWK